MVQKMCSIISGTGDDFSGCGFVCVSVKGEKELYCRIVVFAIITNPPPPHYRAIAFEVALWRFLTPHAIHPGIDLGVANETPG